MKKLHKVLMGLTAIVMAFSMTAMTACVDGNEGGTTPGGTEQGGNNQGGNNQGGNNQGGNNQGGNNQGGNNQGGNNQGGNNQGGNNQGGNNQGGNNQGGNNQGGNNQGGNEGGNQGGNNQGGTTTKSDALKIIEALQTQSFKAISFGYTMNETDAYVSYSCDETGAIFAGAQKQEGKGEHNTEMTEKINIANLEMDMVNYEYSVMLDKDGKPVEDTKYENYNYSFMRGGYSFYTYSKEKITDFSKATFEASATETPEQIEAILAMMPEDGVPAQLLIPVTTLLNLADVYDAATFSNKELTVNFNKVAYKLYNEVLEVIEDLDEDTTVGDIFAAAPVKNLLESLTYGIDAKEVYDEVVEILGGAAAPAEEGGNDQMAAIIEVILAALPQPTEGESIYAYLVRLLESKEVAELVFSIIAPELPASAIAPIAQFKVAEVIAMVAGQQAPTMAEIKQTVKGILAQYATVTEDKVTINMGEDGKTEVSAVELVFAVGDDYTLSSVSFSADVYVEGNSLRRNENWEGENKEPTITYENIENKTTVKLAGTLELNAEEYTLTNINKAKVEKTSYEMVDDTYYSYHNMMYIHKFDTETGSKTETRVYLGATIEDGELKNVAAYIGDGYDEDITYTLIDGCEWSGTDTLTFAIEGVEGKVTCKVNVRVDEYNGQIYYIEIFGSIAAANQTEGYDVQWASSQLYIDPEEVVTTSTVEEILAQAK